MSSSLDKTRFKYCQDGEVTKDSNAKTSLSKKVACAAPAFALAVVGIRDSVLCPVCAAVSTRGPFSDAVLRDRNCISAGLPVMKPIKPADTLVCYQ
jgi:hypothetical protein